MIESPQTLALLTLALLGIALLASYLGDCAGRSMKQDNESPFRFGDDNDQ